MIKNILISSIVFGLLDAFAMSLFMKKLALKHLRTHLSLNGEELQVNMLFALIVYISMVLLSSIFLAPKIMNLSSSLYVWGYGFLFGICSFAVFDFTNGALFKEYPLTFMLTDTLWGGVLFSTAAIFMFKFK